MFATRDILYAMHYAVTLYMPRGMGVYHFQCILFITGATQTLTLQQLTMRQDKA